MRSSDSEATEDSSECIILFSNTDHSGINHNLEGEWTERRQRTEHGEGKEVVLTPCWD